MGSADDLLIIKVETLKNALVSHATGGQADNIEYKSLRQDLLKNERIAPRLPRFLKSCRDLGEFWSFIKMKFGSYQERREFLREQFDPVLTYLEGGLCAPCDADVSRVLSATDSEHIHECWTKALERRSTDPDGAITIARTLLETVCKHILDEEGVEYDDKADLPKLYGLVSKQLDLAPSSHAEKPLNQVLGGCHAVVAGIGSVRTRMGDAHAKRDRPSPYHAELAVNLAGATASFLVSAWNDTRAQDTGW